MGVGLALGLGSGSGLGMGLAEGVRDRRSARRPLRPLRFLLVRVRVS